MSEFASRFSDYNWSRDLLKLIAIMAMTADHVSTYLMEYGTAAYEVCQFFGNFTIVIMCFLIVQGLKHTRFVLNYSQRLLGWAMISEAPFYLLFGIKLNVMFTLLASLLIIFLLDRKGLAIATTALVLFFPLSLICDWSIIAPVFTIIYYELDKHDKEKLSLVMIPGAYFILRTILYDETQMEYVTVTLSIFLAALLVLLFMEQASERGKGRIPGLVFYAYYPAHLFFIVSIYAVV